MTRPGHHQHQRTLSLSLISRELEVKSIKIDKGAVQEEIVNAESGARSMLYAWLVRCELVAVGFGSSGSGSQSQQFVAKRTFKDFE
jgi:hypothetical protein